MDVREKIANILVNKRTYEWEHILPMIPDGMPFPLAVLLTGSSTVAGQMRKETPASAFSSSQTLQELQQPPMPESRIQPSGSATPPGRASQ